MTTLTRFLWQIAGLLLDDNSVALWDCRKGKRQGVNQIRQRLFVAALF